MSLSEFRWKPRFKTRFKLSQSFFLVMLDRAPRTRKLRPCVFHIAEWAPEGVMTLLAASHKFFVRKDVRYFIWFELIKSVSFWKVFRRTSPEMTMLLFCFWPDVQLPKKIPTPTRCKTFCNMATERSMVVYFVVTYCFKAGRVILPSSITSHQGTGCIGTSQNRFLWFKSTRRTPGTEVLDLQTSRNAIEEMTGEKRSLTV